MGCFTLLLLFVLGVVALETVAPGLLDALFPHVAWLLSQHAFWIGAAGATVTAAIWISYGRHLTASQLRRDGYAKADNDYKKYGGW